MPLPIETDPVSVIPRGGLTGSSPTHYPRVVAAQIEAIAQAVLVGAAYG